MSPATVALIAALLEWGRPRWALPLLQYGLTFLVASWLLPDPRAVGIAWYGFCALGELLIIVAMLPAKTPPARFVAMISGINIGLHGLGALNRWLWHAPAIHALYAMLIPLNEYLQVIILLLFADPVFRGLVFALRLLDRGRPWKSERYRTGHS